MSEYEKFKDLLIKFVKEDFQIKQKEKATFFDVAGYPHYENVASNILKFLFDINEEHEFEDLWLKSLLKAYNQKATTKVSTNNLNVLKIKREYSNGFDKRIDLLINADPIIVVIENKIYASVYNPFDIYAQMAINYAKEEQIGDAEFVKIVLSVSKEELDPKMGFVNVTYDELFKFVKELWWGYKPNEKWGMFAIDFMANLQKREGDTHMKIDKKWIDFARGNVKEIKELFEIIQNDINTRISIIQKIDEELDDIKLRKGVYNANKSTYVSQFTDVKTKDGFNVCFETYLMKAVTNKIEEDYDKLYISLWCRGNKDYNFDEILKAIGKENARVRITTGSGCWGKHHILDTIDICEDFSIPEIASRIRHYVEEASKLC